MDNSRIELSSRVRKIERGAHPRRGAFEVRRDIAAEDKARVRRLDDVSGQPTEVAAGIREADPVAASEAPVRRESIWSALAGRLTARRRLPRLG